MRGASGEPAQAGRAFPRPPPARAYDSSPGRAGPRPTGATGGVQGLAAEPAEADGPARPDQRPAGPAAGVLADRLAASLVHHEPGWRLPRHTALARRYNVSTAQIDAAISELVRRHLIRKLADGQLYRVSPAEYLVSLAGVPALAAQADPMGGELTCRSRQISWRRVPEDIGWALGIDLAEPICVARFLWALNGEPAAYATTYLPADLAGHLIEGLDPGASAAGPVAAGQSVAGTAAASSAAASTAAALSLLPLSRPEQGQGQDDRPDPAGTPVALHLEMQLPPPSVARSLRLSAGQSAAIMTVRFDDLATARPVALTVAVLRSDLFRIVVQSGAPPLPGGPGSPEGREGHEGSFAGSWTHAVQDWDS